MKNEDFVIGGTCLLRYVGDETDVTIPEGITYIGEYVFYDRPNVTRVVVPNGVTTIADNAFMNCPNLTSIVMPDSITSIGRCAFSDCPNLTSIVIPKGVTRINDYTFCRCFALTNVTIPNSVKIIGDYAFFGAGLTSVIIPANVTSIGWCAFESCLKLTSVTLGDGVTNIGGFAFRNCLTLKDIIIPNTVTCIGLGAFTHCAFGTVRGYRFKATDASMQCINYRYSLGEWHHTDNAVMCQCGFHSCGSPLDVLGYYNGSLKNVRFWLVKVKGEVKRKHYDKTVSTDILFVKELTISELADYASGRVNGKTTNK